MKPIVRLSTAAAAALVAGTCLLALAGAGAAAEKAEVKVNSVASLARAVNEGAPNDTVIIAPGRYELAAPLQPKEGMTLRGAGADRTILSAAPSWNPGTQDLPGSDTKPSGSNRNAYLIDLGFKTKGVTLSHMTLTGPNLHGAILGADCDGLELAYLHVEDFQWSGVRTFAMSDARVHDNTFVDAGGKHKHNGGALFMTWTQNSEFWNNRITKTPDHHSNFYGFKGRGGSHNRFHHNTVEVGFSLEYPFENDRFIEIDHNAFTGPISIPKHAGGVVPDGGYTFHIHHNWLRKSYALEWHRNGAEIDHNLFDFSTEDDGGNLISGFGKVPAPGPTDFHHNLVRNPGRGLFWDNGPYNNFSFHHNHVIGKTTKTPRKDGLFGFSKQTDFRTISIAHNIIELAGTERPLMRNDASYGAAIANNALTGISNTDQFENPQTNEPRGLSETLAFRAGVGGEYAIDGWTVRRVGPEPSKEATVQTGDTWHADPDLVKSLEKRRAGTLYNEAKVPAYTLPDPLTMADGTKVTDPKQWPARRAEILDLFRTHVYGRAPGRPEKMTFEVFDRADDALGGKARRKQVAIRLTGTDDGPRINLLVYLPADAKGPVPAFLLLNFGGNHAIGTDPGIRLATSWMRDRGEAGDHRATEKSRGKAAKRFPIPMILARGYALATVYYGDIDPDFDDGFKNGVHGALTSPGKPGADAWGSIAAWAWGLSRALDYFETDKDLDAKRVAVLGHSRLGKTALWAGAADERFAIVISNDSGCGGAALSRRAFGETVERINKSFPHWFCGNFKAYNRNEAALPVDQHMLVALMAPRPVYVASADRDLWADPHGEFLSCKGADPVYRLLGTEGLPAATMPPLDTPAQGRIGYHVRTGGHDLSEYDWRQYLDFADKHVGRTR